MKKFATLLLASLLAIATIGSSQAVQYEALNKAIGTSRGTRFNNEIGLEYSKQVQAQSSAFIWSTFGQTRQEERKRKNVDLITLMVETMSRLAYTSNDEIHVSAKHIEEYSGDVRIEFIGLMYHGPTHVWQWNGAGTAPSGLIEGIADFVRVRLKAGYAPSHWVKPGEGSRWDQGYDVTARFFDYLNGLKNGFVAELNALMKTGYSDDFFKQLLGKSVDELWSEYKAQYNS